METTVASFPAVTEDGWLVHANDHCGHGLSTDDATLREPSPGLPVVIDWLVAHA